METPPLLAPGVRRLTVNLDQDDVVRYQDRWPVPHGVALHAYLVEGERRALVDPWNAGGYGLEEVAVDLADLGLGWKDLDWVVFTAPPPADLLARLAAEAPGVTVVAGPLGGTVLDLGAGRTLEVQGGFWTALPGPVVFTGAVYSGLGWVEDEVFAEDLAEDEVRFFDDEALRWFASAPYALPDLAPEALVAPASGLAFRRAQTAADRAQTFVTWRDGEGLDEVVLLWPAGDSARLEALVGGALDVGADLTVFSPDDDATALAAGLVRASLVVAAEGLALPLTPAPAKELWRPAADTEPAELRRGLAERWA